jgi:hypothetical protein
MAIPRITVPVTSLASPQPLGTTITFTAKATDTDPGSISYRYAIGGPGSTSWTMVRDYSVDPRFVFTPTQHDGIYRFIVTARNNSTFETAVSPSGSFSFTTLVTGGVPVVTRLANPLTALFSSPPCASGGLYMRVSILLSGTQTPSYTNWKNCVAGQTLNFIIAGMRATTTYSLKSETSNGSTVSDSATLTFTTGTPNVTFPAVSVVTAPTTYDSSSERFMLMSTVQPSLMAVDLSGTPVWYYLDPSGKAPTLTRPLAGGEMLLLADGVNAAGTVVTSSQILREIDLAGNTIRETNAARVSEQVAAKSGITSDCKLGGTDCLVGAFHHEAILLPSGHTLVLGDEEKIFTDGTQGSSTTNPLDIIGDIIVDLDTNWQVAGYWRAFDHLNANRAAILGETCVNGAEGCPPIILTTGAALDWLHGDALFFTPSDGSVLFSMRNQDWIDKIDYGRGTGTGDVLWTMGKGGDFTINSTDPYPWFSHQHDPGFVLSSTTILALFDNGNTREALPPLGMGFGDSRGYVLTVDQVNKVVTPILLADLGFYSNNFGTAELLDNGDYHFEAGAAAVTPVYSEGIEVFPSAVLGYTTKIAGVACYRSFRMVNLYTPPEED